jgi:hypothetical protein
MIWPSYKIKTLKILGYIYIGGNAIYSSSRACGVMKGHMDKEFILPTNSFGKVVGS